MHRRVWYNVLFTVCEIIVQFVIILCVYSVCVVCVYHCMGEQPHCIQVLVVPMPQLGRATLKGHFTTKQLHWTSLYTASACNGISRGVVGG